MKLHKLIQDTGSKLEVEIYEDELYHEIKKYFGWRKNSEDVSYNIGRMKKLGTSDYDKFIKYLSDKGY